MKLVATTLVGWLLLAAASAPQAQPPQPPTARVVDLKASDGTILKASYFATEKPFPCALLLHQGNRTRQSWDDLAGRLAAAGINTLTFDMRGFGESGGTRQVWTRQESPARKRWADDIDTAWHYLVSQPESTETPSVWEGPEYSVSI